MEILMKMITWLIDLLRGFWNLFFPKANRPPIASFTATPTTGSIPLEVICDASTSSDPDGTITKYTWDFGDGKRGTGTQVTHQYTTTGSYTLTLVVTDNHGTTSSTSQTITTLHVNHPPLASFTVTPAVSGNPMAIACDASASSDPDGSLSRYAWDFGDGQRGTGITSTHLYATSGTFIVRLTVTDNEGATSSAEQSITLSGGALPPDPATVAPALDPTITTSLATDTAFLYTGPQPIQTGVAPGTIVPSRVAVLRGRVIDGDGMPLSAVRITVLHHPEFGSTVTRSDGMFDLAVNGGGLLTIHYAKEGYLLAQRQVHTPWQDYRWLPDVVLLPLPEEKTMFDLTAPAPIQMAQGRSVSDDDGTRQATLLLPQGTQAELVFPDGTTQALSQLSVGITEYTVGASGPQAMPAALPPSSGYTYAVEFSVDEALAAGAPSVCFRQQPVIHYVENFLNIPVGTLVPVGSYDRAQATWIPSDNGRVIKILGITNGLADLDTDGDGTSDTGAALGITDTERRQLASLYQPDQSLWRVPIPHLTAPWDCNFPYGPPDDARAPELPEPGTDDQPDDQCEVAGSIIQSQGQTLGEEVALSGTPFFLRYQSDRVPGRRAAYSLDIPLSGAKLPASLKQIVLEVSVAGRLFSKSFPAVPEQRYQFEWDGKDAYGRLVQGRRQAMVRVGYVYQAVYQEPAKRERTFALLSGIPLSGIQARREITLWQEWHVTLGMWNSRAQSLGGWTLDVHHAYDPIGQDLFLGDGSSHRGKGIDTACITTVAGNGTKANRGYTGDHGPATDAQFSYLTDAAVGPDGSLYLVDRDSACMRKVDPDGIITTVAGNGTKDGEGVPATDAHLASPTSVAVGPEGSLYIADYGNFRVRRVDPDGIITTVAGNGTRNYGGDGGPATAAQFITVAGVAAGPDDSFYITDTSAIRVRKVPSMMQGLSSLLIPSEDGAEAYIFNRDGRHLLTRDALTGAVRFQFTYDGAGRLTAVMDGDGKKTTIERDSDGHPTAIISPYEQRTTLTVDANGYLAGIINPAGEAVQLSYTADGLLISLTDPRGNTSSFKYDTTGRLTRDEDAAGGVKDLIRTEQEHGYTVKLLTGLLQERTYAIEHTSNGDERRVNACCGGLQTTSVKQPNGTTTTSFPDGTQTTEVLGPDLRWGMLAPLSKQREIKTPGGLTLRITSERTVNRANRSNPLSLTDLTDTVTRNGQTYKSTYTATNNTIISTTPAGRQVTTTLDSQGRLATQQVVGLSPVSYSYDDHGRLHMITQGTGAVTRTTKLRYTSAGDLESVTNPLGQVTSFVYNAAGRVTTQTRADGNVIGYNYDANGNLIALTPPGRQDHTFTYTPVDLVSSYAPPRSVQETHRRSTPTMQIDT